MKKLAAAILTVLLLMSTAYAADIDISGLTFDELLDLQKQVSDALWASPEWQDVAVPAGVYQIGVDIPAGRWELRAQDGYGWIYYGESDGVGINTDWDAQYLTFYLVSDDIEGFESNRSAVINMQDGYFIQLDTGVFFSRPKGFSFN